MCEKIKAYWSDLDVTVKVNKRELVLGVAVCTLAGLVAGMFLSPRKNVTMGSHNGSNNIVDKRGIPGDCQPAEDEDEEE